MNIYYVYCHIRLDTNKIFYVGKGKENRAYDKHMRSKHWKSIVNKHGFSVQILQRNLDEDIAFEIEKFCIIKFKAFGYPLINITNGGEGPSGAVRSKETRLKISEANKGKIPHNKGLKASQELRLKLSLAHLGQTPHNKGKRTPEEHILKFSKIVQCVETGMVFKSAREASLFLGFSLGAVSNAIKRNSKCGGLHWKYL